MTKWIAKINENDELFGEEILLGVEGGETGFEIVLSNGDDSDVMPGMSVAEAKENLEDYFSCFDTFTWLEGDEGEE